MRTDGATLMKWVDDFAYQLTQDEYRYLSEETRNAAIVGACILCAADIVAEAIRGEDVIRETEEAMKRQPAESKMPPW